MRLVTTATFGLLMVRATLAAPQRPSETDAVAAVEKARSVALAYGKSLPDFVCTEVVNRYTDPSLRRGLQDVTEQAADLQIGNHAWARTDTLTVKLTYFEHKEDHKLVSINGKPSTQAYASQEGAVGIGEFGDMVENIFSPKSEARFRWQSRKTVRGRTVSVYSYVVDPSHSKYAITSGAPGSVRRVIVGFHGVVELDGEAGAILHFTYEADHIPRTLGVDDATTVVDYDRVDIAGADFWLPVSSETETRGPEMALRNQVEFRQYQKFTSDSSVSFGPVKLATARRLPTESY